MKGFYRLLTILLFSFALLTISTDCGLKKTVNLGFSAELTGSRGELGVDLRDGAILAVEEINSAGGIDGRTINLIIKDDEGSKERALEVDSELLEQDVYAIIGHVTSLITGEAIKQANEREVVLFSPASASSDFSGHKDFFFRNMGDNRLSSINMARHIFKNRDLKSVCLIYDIANRSFTESYIKHFISEYTAQGGTIVNSFEFLPGKLDFKVLAQDINRIDCEAILILATAVDTALILQHINQADSQVAYFAHGWAHTSELINKGGYSVEGLELGASFNNESDNSNLMTFKKSFENRFSRSPGFLAAYSYEAVKILTLAIEKAEFKREHLPEELAKIKGFPGLLGEITLNEYGDVLRDSYIVRVEDGEFKFVETVKPPVD